MSAKAIRVLLLSLTAMAASGCGKSEPRVVLNDAYDFRLPTPPNCWEDGESPVSTLGPSKWVCPPVYCNCESPMRDKDPTEPMWEVCLRANPYRYVPRGKWSRVEFGLRVEPTLDVEMIHRFALEELHAEVTKQAPYVAIKGYPKFTLYYLRLLDNSRWSLEEAMRRAQNAPWVISVYRRGETNFQCLSACDPHDEKRLAWRPSPHRRLL